MRPRSHPNFPLKKVSSTILPIITTVVNLLAWYHRYCSCLVSILTVVSLFLYSGLWFFLIPFPLTCGIPQGSFLNQFLSTCILHPSVLSSPHSLSITISMPTRLNSLFLSHHKPLLLMLLSFKTQS